MNRVTHFEIHAADPERAAKFYSTVFGWEINKWEGFDQPYWIVMTADKDSKEPGIHGGLLQRKSLPPTEGQAVNAFVCTVQVENLDETVTAITQAGGTLALPKFALPGMAWQAYYKDTEGNIFGIHQTDPSAK